MLAFGSAFRGLAGGQASLIVYGDGTFNVGAWGRDTDPAKQVVAVRQNLQLLVDGGRPTPETGNVAAWGGSVAGVATMRSAVGVDANGALVWAGGRLSPADLANAIIAAGGVRAMEMDINPDWVHFNSYDVAADGSAHGNGLFGATGADRFLHPDQPRLRGRHGARHRAARRDRPTRRRPDQRRSARRIGRHDSLPRDLR